MDLSNYELKTQDLDTSSQKHQTRVNALNTKFGHIYPRTTDILTHPYRLDSGIIASPTEWLLNTEIKSKYKRYLGLLSSFPVFFPYNSFIDQEVNPAK